MKVIFIFLSSMLLWLQVAAQTDGPNMDSILREIREENKELYANSYEENEESVSFSALITAWRNGDANFIINAIDSVKLENALSPEYFLGIQLLLGDEIEENDAKNILAVHKQLKTKYSKDTAVNKFLVAYDLWMCQFLYEPFEIENITSNALHLLAKKELELDEESLSMLYTMRKVVLELDGKIKERDSFTVAFYKKYPEALKINYLLSQNNYGNHQIVVDAIKNTKDPNPMLIMAAAQSNAQLKNNKDAMRFFDELLSRYDNPQNESRSRGGIPTIFEDNMEGSTSFLAEDVEQMVNFYFNQNNKKQACLALEMLNATIFNEEEVAPFNSKNDYLKGAMRKKLEQENEVKEIETKKKRTMQVALWQKQCD